VTTEKRGPTEYEWIALDKRDPKRIIVIRGRHAILIQATFELYLQVRAKQPENQWILDIQPEHREVRKR
jgi:hypothetical protein